MDRVQFHSETLEEVPLVLTQAAVEAMQSQQTLQYEIDRLKDMIDGHQKFTSIERVASLDRMPLLYHHSADLEYLRN